MDRVKIWAGVEGGEFGSISDLPNLFSGLRRLREEEVASGVRLSRRPVENENWRNKQTGGSDLLENRRKYWEIPGILISSEEALVTVSHRLLCSSFEFPEILWLFARFLKE